MRPETEQLVRESWDQFAPVAEQSAGYFYEKLFELDPEAQRLFARTDMELQGKKVMRMFAEIVRTLMEAKAPLGFSAWDNELPLHAAAARGHWSVVEALLEAGVEPDQADRGGQTALMRAAAGGHDKVVASLLRLGAAPDLPDREGWTALMHAAAHSSSGSVAAIRDLVRAGAGVDRRAGPEGKTPLMVAAEKGSGARTDLKSRGKTALDLALAEGNKRCAERLGYVEKPTR